MREAQRGRERQRGRKTDRQTLEPLSRSALYVHNVLCSVPHSVRHRASRKREEEEEQVQGGEQVQEEGQTERLLLGGSDGESDRGIATQTTKRETQR